MKKFYKRRSKKRGPVQAKKVTYDGINFASGLEKYMYMALKKAKIKCTYEGETFHLLNGFHFPNKCFARCANGKGCLLYTSPSPRDMRRSRMPSSA